jgi:uncharacterized membrane protein HdeD (DUF308 family)
MTEFSTVVCIALIKSITVLGLTYGIVTLSSQDKPGWGWLVFIAVLVASTSYRYVKD